MRREHPMVYSLLRICRKESLSFSSNPPCSSPAAVPAINPWRSLQSFHF